MTILEYLVFGEISPKLKETLKKVYFGVQGGKEAEIVELKDGIMCQIDAVTNHRGNDPHAPVIVNRTTLKIDNNGEIVSKKEEKFTKIFRI